MALLDHLARGELPAFDQADMNDLRERVAASLLANAGARPLGRALLRTWSRAPNETHGQAKCAVTP